MSTCILVMCGLPASGKTTLVSQFQFSVSEQLTCYVVDYDRLMPPEVEGDLIREHTGQSKDLSLWKKYRGEIIHCVDRLLQEVSDSDLTKFTEKSVAASAQHNLSDDGKTKSCEQGQLWKHFMECLGSDGETPHGRGRTVVIVDDNMYYRSMRYDYYQLARKYSLGFCEVFVDCSTLMALARNEQRKSGKVREHVIVAMADKMEVPDSASYHWEKYSLVLSSDAEDKCSKMHSMVISAMGDPVLAPVEDLEGKAESRRVCSTNVIHQADQIIRKMLAENMKMAKSRGKSKEDMKHMSVRLSDVKAAILEDMRSGVITFDTDAQNASKEESSELFKFVKELFEKKTLDIS